MKLKLLEGIFSLLFCLVATNIFCVIPPWGFHGHKKINEMAVYTLPQDLFPFYFEHLDEIIALSVAPDKRRYAVIGEAQKHYIDIDHYQNDSIQNVFAVLPQNWKEACQLLSEDTLNAYGTAPWNVTHMLWKLTKAFENKDSEKIIRLSSELGHYVADAHVPLHTTENYNGQLSNQDGIHGLWESRLPELYDTQYDFVFSKSKYIAHPSSTIWKVVEESHHALDSVFTMEIEATKMLGAQLKYCYEDRGRTNVRTYSKEYCKIYHHLLDGQVERRMRSAVILIGDLWFTAWVNAGQPELSTTENTDLECPQKQQIRTKLRTEPKSK